jgi:hypothetical protein
MADNLLDSWSSFDALNEFPMIKNLRVTGNPIVTVVDEKP